MSDAEIFGRQLLAQTLTDLSVIGERQRCFIGQSISAPSFSAGVISGMVAIAKNFPFDAPAASHFFLAETLIQTYLQLTGETEELQRSQIALAKIKEQFYGSTVYHKGNPRIN